jgi:UDP-N-acetylglucosamine transferase subunit ALG13
MGRNVKIIPKSKIRRFNILILILLGTQDNSFHRLLEEVQKLINKNVITEKVIVQAGRTKYESKDMEIYSLMPEEKLAELMKKSDLVITHGGVGSIVMALKMGKKVIAVPRLSEFGEHINDHQIQIIDSFNSQEFLIGITELKDLEEALKRSKEFKPKKFESKTEHMINLIEDFIDNN